MVFETLRENSGKEIHLLATYEAMWIAVAHRLLTKFDQDSSPGSTNYGLCNPGRIP